MRRDETEKRDEEGPGLPLVRTWEGVYLLVIGSFLLWVILLAALTEWRP